MRGSLVGCCGNSFYVFFSWYFPFILIILQLCILCHLLCSTVSVCPNRLGCPRWHRRRAKASISLEGCTLRNNEPYKCILNANTTYTNHHHRYKVEHTWSTRQTVICRERTNPTVKLLKSLHTKTPTTAKEGRVRQREFAFPVLIPMQIVPFFFKPIEVFL